MAPRNVIILSCEMDELQGKQGDPTHFHLLARQWHGINSNGTILLQGL
jgi:hypothetical protein